MQIIQPKIEVPDDIYDDYCAGRLNIMGLAKDADNNRVVKHLDTVSETEHFDDDNTLDNADNTDSSFGEAVVAAVVLAVAAITTITIHSIGKIAKKKVAVFKTELLMNQAGVSVENRKTVAAALKKAEETSAPATAIELEDGTVVVGKTTNLLGASAAAILNALKVLGGVHDSIDLISRIIIEPIQKLKTGHLGNHNPRLHVDEVLIALAISAATNPTAELALKQIPKLIGCEVHSSVILSEVDRNVFRKLKMNLTCEPQYQTKKLFHK
jgi:hypothetical protein